MLQKHKIDDLRKASLRAEYLSRINRVIDYIEANLDKELSLDILSRVACFSHFHFHRIFSAMVGETLNRFIQRLRIEKAAAQLICSPWKPITEIALDCGFSCSAAFARVFKENFGMSASEWRSRGVAQESKIRKTRRKDGQPIGNIRKEVIQSSCYIDDNTNNLTWRIEMKDKQDVHVEVMEMPAYHVAYVRHIGPYKGDSNLFENLFNRLMRWAGPRNLLRFPETQIMSVYHDDPKITDENKLRTSVCITVPEDTPVEGDIGKMTVPGGKFAAARFELSASGEYQNAWDFVYGTWLPESGFQPDDRLCYELYRNNPKEHPEGLHIVDICVPVKPL